MYPISADRSESNVELDQEKYREGEVPAQLEGALKELRLSDSHREYLVSRHGRLDLEPLPSMSPDDPLNWPTWRKNTQALLVAFHSMMCTFMAAGIIPAAKVFAEEYGVSVHTSAYLTSIQIAVIGIVPFIWNPIAARYGRRPVFMISVLGSAVCNIGGARCTSFGAQLATRALTAMFISPPIGIGSGVITELYFNDERATKMGWWTLLLTLGVPVGPFLMGFVVKHAGAFWMFWIFAIINLCQLVAYIFLGGETLFPREDVIAGKPIPKGGRLSFSRIDPTPFSLRGIFAPLFMARYIDVMIPSIAYAVVFCYAGVAVTVEMPSVFGERYHLDPQQLGLLFISIIIGGVLGEVLSAPLTDLFLEKYQAWVGYKLPANRLWASYIGFLTAIVGLLVWGIRVEQANNGIFNVTPLVGAAIASFGNQVVTTALISFSVECHQQEAAGVGVLVNLLRQEIGFVGPFYFPLMFKSLNFAGSAGLMCGIIVAFAVLPVAALHWVRTKAR
ncbi:uncharacterized protein GIQ15_04594 [Arthroderma uncinatum]|uniref:uncharacterized protein n=1 Tax=Arthroderma uncinatum TaxID=74035 RepID=UPI00144AA89F|nr:uncharacterized protein GIQ15_04594 [Arthroderma uncinatum]KAF3481835.1 hypothetical protein GIQ15_04594 [Arthroderma uncinatum]